MTNHDIMNNAEIEDEESCNRSEQTWTKNGHGERVKAI